MRFAVFGFLCFFLAQSVRANPFENPGFEQDKTGWALNDQMSTVQAEAAHGGAKGLRITDESAEAGSSVQSSRFPVKAGQDIELSFWAKTQSAGFVGVYLWFYDGSGKLIKDENQKAGQGHPVVGVKQADGQWHENKLATKAPEGAASVSVWIHSFGSAQGTADFDDFSFSGIDGSAAPVAAAETKAPLPPPDLSARKTPPYIVIKVDDFRPIDGQVHGLWKKLADYLKSKNIKGSIGMLMDKNSEASPEYIQWVKDKQASGDIEFWLHGWDHAAHTEEGVQYNEFDHRSFDEQKKRFDDSQRVAKEQLGFVFHTFGPPGGPGKLSFDASTVQVMAEEPEMKVWLYPQPLDEQGKKLEEAGKVVILDRVWAVNFESSVGNPNFQKFLEGYAKNPDRSYFVLQGHPMHWGSPEKFGEFTKIIDFLIAQKAVFVTPSELAAKLGASAK